MSDDLSLLLIYPVGFFVISYGVWQMETYTHNIEPAANIRNW